METYNIPIFTDIAIEKLSKMDCEIFGIQTPFIVFIYNNTFYKCNINQIISISEIEDIISQSIIPETIIDLK